MTITVITEAASQEDAEIFFEDMGVTFSDPVDNCDLQHNLLDWEIEEVDSPPRLNPFDALD